MSDAIQRLHEKRHNVWLEAKALNDSVVDEGRDFTAEEAEKWDRMNADISAFDATIERTKALAEAESRYEIPAADPAPEQRDEPSDADIIRSMARGERRSYEFRDLTVGTTTAGGYLRATGFYSQLQEHMIENSAILQTNVTVLTTETGSDLQVPKTTTHPTAAIISEASTLTESDAAFGQITLGSYKFAFSTQISSELEQDSAVDLEGYLARVGGQALANGAGVYFITGNDTGQPNGLATASTLGVTGGAGVAGVFTADELINLFYSVIAPYRARGTWMMSDVGIRNARKLKDSNNQYLWQPGLVANETSTLLGRPLVSDTNVADPALSAKSVLFGDISTYFIRQVQGVRVERSVDFAFQTDLVTWRFIWRADGDLIDRTGSVKHFIGNAA